MQPRFVLVLAPFAALAFVHCSSTTTIAEAPLPADDGGIADSAAPPSDAESDGRAFDAATSALASMSKARSLFAAVNGKDGRVRVLGGLGLTGLDDSAEAYDPASNQWSVASGKSSVKRYGHAAAEDNRLGSEKPTVSAVSVTPRRPRRSSSAARARRASTR